MKRAILDLMFSRAIAKSNENTARPEKIEEIIKNLLKIVITGRFLLKFAKNQLKKLKI